MLYLRRVVHTSVTEDCFLYFTQKRSKFTRRASPHRLPILWGRTNSLQFRNSRQMDQIFVHLPPPAKQMKAPALRAPSSMRLTPILNVAIIMLVVRLVLYQTIEFNYLQTLHCRMDLFLLNFMSFEWCDFSLLVHTCTYLPVASG